eukprot:SAG11_NODE_1615_length_4578_cov_6.001786_1_plen_50_part_00
MSFSASTVPAVQPPAQGSSVANAGSAALVLSRDPSTSTKSRQYPGADAT